MRTFLRLDFLYNQALHHNERGSPWGSRAAMASLIDILAITTRGDVRSDVLKELESQLTLLNDFQSKPGVDTQRLKSLTANLVRLRADLLHAGSAFLQPLRDSEFLSAIKHRSAIPGGTCEFDLPDYYFWLSQPDEARMRSLQPVARPAAPAVRLPSPSCCGSRARTAAAADEIARGGSFAITFERDNPLAAAAHLAARRRRHLPGDQRQPPPLQRALPDLERTRQPRDARRSRRAVHIQLLRLTRRMSSTWVP